MGAARNLSRTVGRKLAPRVVDAAPQASRGFVREALRRAIDGVGPFPGAAEAADHQLAEQGGDVDRGVHEVIENHIRYAGAQGFLTNIGGLVTMTVTVPANITGLAVIQCRMVAGIAHLRGYDLADQRTRNAILACLLGEEEVARLVKRRKLPAPPMALATAPSVDPELAGRIAGQVASDMVSRITGKRMATTIGRRVPVVGGVIGLSADAYATWRLGRYADREFLPRNRR